MIANPGKIIVHGAWVKKSLASDNIFLIFLLTTATAGSSTNDNSFLPFPSVPHARLFRQKKQKKPASGAEQAFFTPLFIFGKLETSRTICR